MQDCILVVRPFRKAFPKHHALSVLGPAEGEEAKDVPHGRLLPEQYWLLALAHCILSPHMSLLLEGFLA